MSVAITVLLLSGVEAVFKRLNHPPPSSAAAGASPAVSMEGTYTTTDFFQPDALLGYKPRPGTTVTSLKKAGDETIYDVTYSIDPFSRRVTPAAHPAKRSRFALLFGCSFVFGEGVEDEETLAAYLAEAAPGYRTYNYGFCGYGPQQMLAQLESGKLKSEIPEASGICLYFFIDNHIERAVGSMAVYNLWGRDMPYYTLDGRGDIVRKGTFASGRPLKSAFYSWLGRSEAAAFFDLNLPARLGERHFEFTAELIAAARDAFRSCCRSDEFFVVFYPGHGTHAKEMIPLLDRLGVRFLDYGDRFRLDPDQGFAIPGDAHPTGKAHRRVAEWIAADLGLNADRPQP
jgi:hypothetical protein